MKRRKPNMSCQSNIDDHSDKTALSRAVLALSAIAICTKIFGFAEKFIIAHFFGTGDTADVYFAAMGIILSIVYLVKELVYPSLLPVFADSLHREPSLSGSLFRKAFLSTTAILVVGALILAIFSNFISKIFVPGFSASKLLMTSKLLRALAPALLFLSLTMVTVTVLNAHKRFLAGAWPEAALKLFIALGLIVLVPLIGISALAVVVGIGSLCCLLMQMFYVPERCFLLGWSHQSNDSAAFKKVLFLMGPLVIGVLFSHISGLIDNALASTLPSGNLSYLGYSKKLIDAILLIGPVALVTVVYSQLSHLVSARKFEAATSLISTMFRLLLYVSVPMACLLILLREPIIKCLFERGQFDVLSTHGTSQAFMIYAVGLMTFSLENLVVCSFFALSDTRTPVKIGIVCVIIDIILAVLFLKPFGYLGIAAAFVIAKTIKILILTLELNKKLNGFIRADMLAFAAKLTVSAIFTSIVIRVLSAIENSASFFHEVFFDLVLPTVGGMCAFVILSCLLRMSELGTIMSLLKYRKTAVNNLGGQSNDDSN